jgi:hypothetical protein
MIYDEVLHVRVLYTLPRFSDGRSSGRLHILACFSFSWPVAGNE